MLQIRQDVGMQEEHSVPATMQSIMLHGEGLGLFLNHRNRSKTYPSPKLPCSVDAHFEGDRALRSLCASADHDVRDKERQLKLEEEMKSGIRTMFSDDALTHVGGDNIGWSQSVRLGADDGGCDYTILDVLVIFYLQRRLQKSRARQ